ncbi:MAG TPA: hypothetical protein PKY02_06225, partial [Synergistales bacterium]|nr:hypothetical protein [Synergistales bacterium]
MLSLGFGAGFPGIDAVEALREMEGRLEKGLQRLLEGARAKEDGFGWLDLPDSLPEGLFDSVAWLSGFDSVVQIGIGGSALGNRMISSAIGHPFYNELTRKERMAPRFYIADNADPEKASAILGMIDVALPKVTDPTVQDCLQTAKGSADLLLALLDGLLDSAKIESGKLELESAPFSLRRMLDQITRVLKVA